jgi:hypothetical protein
MMTSLTSRPQNVALLGAFDRFNYGDLLFPIIAQNEIREHSPATGTSVFALANSDLGKYGALKTRNLHAFYAKGQICPNDVIMFAGGGTIGVDWLYMHQNLLGPLENRLLYGLQRLFGRPLVNDASRWYLGGRSPFPWIMDPKDFPMQVHIAYNAVGGSELSKATPELRELTLKLLSSASYISVRDSETKRQFAPIEEQVAVELAPDSAVIISEQFPKAMLEKRATPAILEQTSREPYICFQCDLDYANTMGNAVIRQLERIYEHHGLRTLLLPIGRYNGLDDPIALRDLLGKLATPAEIVSDQATIWDIMLVIARARIFVGTSLHGNITSQSFAVPHIGLSEQPRKLDYYLDTWDLPEHSGCLNPDDILRRVDKALTVPEQARTDLRSRLLAESHANFGKMAHACNIDWT